MSLNTNIAVIYEIVVKDLRQSRTLSQFLLEL